MIPTAKPELLRLMFSSSASSLLFFSFYLLCQQDTYGSGMRKIPFQLSLIIDHARLPLAEVHIFTNVYHRPCTPSPTPLAPVTCEIVHRPFFRLQCLTDFPFNARKSAIHGIATFRLFRLTLVSGANQLRFQLGALTPVS